jgi:glycosyltransferase involved in cell wall biosynthesis
MAERLRVALLGLMPADKSPSILFLLPDADTGGGQTAAVRLANELAKTHRVFLVNARPLLDDGNLAKMLSDRVALLEGRLHALAHLRYSKDRPNPTETDLSPIRVSALSSLCDWLGIEIVFSHVWWADKLAHALVKSTPMRWFLHMHGCYEFLIDSGHSDPLHDREICNFPDLARDIFQRVDGVLYLDDKNLAVFERLKIPRPPLRPARNGFEDPEPLQQINGDQPLRSQLDEIVFCMCARGIPEKGWEQAIAATRRVNRLPANQRGNKKARLVTIGSSDYLDKLLNKHSDALEITSIGLQESPIDTMRKCHVGLLPTYFVSESQPNVVIEYMAAGLAVISTAIGTIPQMLVDDGLQAGVALPCGDKVQIEDGLVQEMARLMRESKELEKRRQHAREIFRSKYHIRSIASDLMAFFEDSTRKSDVLRDCSSPQLNQNDQLYFSVNKIIKKTGVIGIDLELINNSFFSNTLSLSGNNTGNILFNYSAYSHLIYGHFIGFYFSEQIKHINANMSSLLIPAANWINAANDWGFLADLLEKIKIPICCVGLGSQNSIHEIDKIPLGTVAFLKVLKEKNRIIGVRGFQTKAILEKLGVFNVEVVGCPSIFTNFNPITKLVLLADHNNPRLSISFTRYTKSDPDQHGYQKKIAQLAAQFSSSIVLQSEESEIRYLENPDAETASWLCSYYHIDESELPRLISKLQFFNSQESWVQFHRDNTDFTISSRIHGCVASLLAGKPALLLAHDQRTSELAETMGIPQRPIECVHTIQTKEDLLNLIRDLDFTDFFAKQITNLEKLKHLYKTCGVETSLQSIT